MKVYDYRCDECGYFAEYYVNDITEEIVCPECHETMTRLTPGTRTTFKEADKSGIKRARK